MSPRDVMIKSYAGTAGTATGKMSHTALAELHWQNICGRILEQQWHTQFSKDFVSVSGSEPKVAESFLNLSGSLSSLASNPSAGNTEM